MRCKAWKRVSLKFRSVLQVVSFSGAAEAVGFVYGGTGLSAGRAIAVVLGIAPI